jgi:hypothetical protein
MTSLRSIKASWPSAQSRDGYYATPSQLVTSRSVNWRDPLKTRKKLDESGQIWTLTIASQDLLSDLWVIGHGAVGFSRTCLLRVRSGTR